MTNTDRLAQALRECLQWGMSPGEWDLSRSHARAALEEYETTRAALASLAPAAVEGEFLNIANDCRAVATMEMLSVSARARLLLAAEIVEKSSSQVSALTAQCEGLSAQLALLKTEAMVSEFEDGSIDVFWKDDKRSALLNIPSDREAPTSFAFKERSAIAAGNGEGV